MISVTHLDFHVCGRWRENPRIQHAANAISSSRHFWLTEILVVGTFPTHVEFYAKQVLRCHVTLLAQSFSQRTHFVINDGEPLQPSIGGVENTASKPCVAPIFCVIVPSIYQITNKLL
jgi:hypothetical protein